MDLKQCQFSGFVLTNTAAHVMAINIIVSCKKIVCYNDAYDAYDAEAIELA